MYAVKYALIPMVLLAAACTQYQGAPRTWNNYGRYDTSARPDVRGAARPGTDRAPTTNQQWAGDPVGGKAETAVNAGAQTGTWENSGGSSDIGYVAGGRGIYRTDAVPMPDDSDGGAAAVPKTDSGMDPPGHG